MTTPSADAVQRQFGAASAAYAYSAVHANGPDLPPFVDAAAPNATDHALDVATGAGHSALAIAAKVAQVTAVDITPAMVETARHTVTQRGAANVEVRQADAHELPFEDASFDIVSCRVSAHHFADVRRAIREMARVLRPGGRIAISDTIAPEEPVLDTFSNTVELLRDISHVRNYRATEWLGFFVEAGLTAEVIARSGFVLDGQSWVQRMNTPASRVAVIRELFSEARPAERAYFEIQDNPWAWTLPYAVFRATKA